MIKWLIIVGAILLATVIVTGCTDKDPNYYYSHFSASAPFAISGDACGLYYENITVLDKTTEIVGERFGSRTSYVIVTDDGISREAISFAVYRQLVPNNTYTVISSDRKGCGYTSHHIWIGSVWIGGVVKP